MKVVEVEDCYSILRGGAGIQIENLCGCGLFQEILREVVIKLEHAFAMVVQHLGGGKLNILLVQPPHAEPPLPGGWLVDGYLV